MDVTYETHLKIKQNKLCPFKYLVSKDRTDYGICNWHENIEILLITRGEGLIQYGKDYLHVSRGTVVVVNSGTLHRLCSKEYDVVCLIIDESFCIENGIETTEKLFDSSFVEKKTEELLLGVVDKIHDYTQNLSDTAGAKARLAVLELLIHLAEKHSTPKVKASVSGKGAEEYVKKIIEFLNSHYTERFTLEELAHRCGVTKFHLAREFKRYTGSTVFTYINSLRCKNAESCLGKGMSVTEAALQSGFESVSYFSRTYKKIVGHSPSKNQ